MKKWDECNKPYALSKRLFSIQGVNVFSGGKPDASYFKVAKFFKKCPAETLNLLHEYMDSIESPQKFTMTELFHRAASWNTDSKITKITSTTTTNYLDILKEWKE